MPGLTRRLGESVAQLCRVASIRPVASFFGLDWKTVKDLDFASLQHQLGPVDLDGLEVIGMDEFAIQKGQAYATDIVEPMPPIDTSNSPTYRQSNSSRQDRVGIIDRSRLGGDGEA